MSAPTTTVSRSNGLPPGTRILEVVYHSHDSLVKALMDAEAIMDEADVPDGERENLRVQLLGLLSARQVNVIPDGDPRQQPQIAVPMPGSQFVVPR